MSNKDEKTAWVIVRAIIGLVGVLFLLFGFVIKPNPVEGTLWEALHPASVLNYTGVVMFISFLFGLTGVYSTILPAGSTWLPKVLYAIGFLGVLFIFL